MDTELSKDRDHAGSLGRLLCPGSNLVALDRDYAGFPLGGKRPVGGRDYAHIQAAQVPLAGVRSHELTRDACRVGSHVLQIEMILKVGKSDLQLFAHCQSGFAADWSGHWPAELKVLGQERPGRLEIALLDGIHEGLNRCS